jgi:diguanylate cyclase (GGDEF)-like protein
LRSSWSGSVGVSILRSAYNPTIRSRAELRRYALSVAAVAVSVTLAVDVTNHLVFFVNWGECLRDWAIDALTVPLVAYPISYAMGRTHLLLYRAKSEAERLSRTDPLTGLANRRAFYEAARRLGAEAAATLAIADIDRFKRINDRHGHAVGDEVIRAVAARMQQDLGDLGVVARLGGEEFALLGPAQPGDEMRARLQRFVAGVAGDAVATPGEPVRATVSVGFATGANADLDALYAAADKALYVAKSAGRDRVVDGEEIADVAPPAALRA